MIDMTPEEQLAQAEQGSALWHQARLGKCTGSRLGDALGKLNSGKWAEARNTYMLELISEKLTGDVSDHFVSGPMKWGIANESAAVNAYEFYTDEKTAPIGFIQHPRIERFGATPDRLIGDEGLLEIKCPTTKVHFQTLLAGEMPEEHMPQIQGELACTGRKWADFMSYDPRLPPEMQVFIRRIPRVDVVTRQVEVEVVNFLAEMDAKVAALWAAVAPERKAA